MARAKLIKISDGKQFDGKQWKNAIEYFLHAMANGDLRPENNPFIAFEDERGMMVVMYLDPSVSQKKAQVYLLQSQTHQPPTGHESPNKALGLRSDGVVVITGSERRNVEWDLRNFALNGNVIELRVSFGYHTLVLWKDRSQPGFLGVSTVGTIPKNAGQAEFAFQNYECSL